MIISSAHTIRSFLQSAAAPGLSRCELLRPRSRYPLPPTMSGLGGRNRWLPNLGLTLDPPIVGRLPARRRVAGYSRRVARDPGRNRCRGVSADRASLPAHIEATGSKLPSSTRMRAGACGRAIAAEVRSECSQLLSHCCLRSWCLPLLQMTHGPAYGQLDEVPDYKNRNLGNPRLAGCRDLLAEARASPPVPFFTHCPAGLRNSCARKCPVAAQR